MKDLSKLPAVKELGNAFILLKKNAFLLVIASLIDAVFFLAWGFFTAPVSDKILEHSILLTNQLSALMQEQGKVPTGLLSKLIGPQLWPYTAKLLALIFLLFVVIYIIYVIFHGTSWWMGTKIAGEKVAYRKYLLGFARVNLLWMLCFMIYKFLDVIISLRYVLVQKIAPGAPNIAGNVLLIVLVLFGISAFLSYPYLRVKTIFKTPLRVSAPLVFFSACLYLAAQFILNMIGKYNIDAALIFGLIILFPTMNLIRVYAIRVLSHVRTHP